MVAQLIRRLHHLILDVLLSLCEHPPGAVVADILEGDAAPVQISWCRLCGAYRIRGEFRRPRPRWEKT